MVRPFAGFFFAYARLVMLLGFRMILLAIVYWLIKRPNGRSIRLRGLNPCELRELPFIIKKFWYEHQPHFSSLSVDTGAFFG